MNDKLKPGDLIRIRVHDCIRPDQPVVGTYVGRSPNRHWFVDVEGETHLVAAAVVDCVETAFDVS